MTGEVVLAAARFSLRSEISTRFRQRCSGAVSTLDYVKMSRMTNVTSLKRQSNTLLTYFSKKTLKTESTDLASASECEASIFEDSAIQEVPSHPEGSCGKSIFSEPAPVPEPVNTTDVGVYDGKSVSAINSV